MKAQLEEAQRAARRQAAPFRRRRRKTNPAKPGRKPGHPPANRSVPEQIDEEIFEPLDCGPCCGGEVQDVTDVAPQVVVDLPPIKPITRRCHTQSGFCSHCKKRVRSRHRDHRRASAPPTCFVEPPSSSRSSGAARFPLAIRRLILGAIAVKRDETLCAEDIAGLAEQMRAELRVLLAGDIQEPANRRFARHLRKHEGEIFTFLDVPALEPTNNQRRARAAPGGDLAQILGGQPYPERRSRPRDPGVDRPHRDPQWPVPADAAGSATRWLTTALGVDFDESAVRICHRLERMLDRLHLESHGHFASVLNALEYQVEDGRGDLAVVRHLGDALLRPAEIHALTPDTIKKLTQGIGQLHDYVSFRTAAR